MWLMSQLQTASPAQIGGYARDRRRLVGHTL
jgi:hypothetical protein